MNTRSFLRLVEQGMQGVRVQAPGLRLVSVSNFPQSLNLKEPVKLENYFGLLSGLQKASSLQILSGEI